MISIMKVVTLILIGGIEMIINKIFGDRFANLYSGIDGFRQILY